jgi:hypothetical protein
MHHMRRTDNGWVQHLVDKVNQKIPSGGANDRFIGHPGLCSNPVRLTRLEGTDEMPPHLR